MTLDHFHHIDIDSVMLDRQRRGGANAAPVPHIDNRRNTAIDPSVEFEYG